MTRFYYFAYWVGLVVSGGSFWLMCWVWPPKVVETGWKEPRDYVRPEEEEQQEVITVAEAASENGVVVGDVSEKGGAGV